MGRCQKFLPQPSLIDPIYDACTGVEDLYAGAFAHRDDADWALLDVESMTREEIKTDDVREAVRLGLSPLVDSDEDDALDGEDAVTRHHVAHLRAHGERCSPEPGRTDAELNKIPLWRRTDEVDLRHVLRDCTRVAELKDRVDRCFLIDPAQ